MTPYINRPNIAPPTYCNAVVPEQRANATFVMLARNSDVDGAVHAVRSVEDRFNRNYNYPWVFLNEEPFSDDFKRYARPSSPPLSEFSHMLTPVSPLFPHKSRVNHRHRACVFRPGPWRALVSAFVDRRDKGEGGER